MSENGEIYSAGKNFTLPPALTAWTNSTSVFWLALDQTNELGGGEARSLDKEVGREELDRQERQSWKRWKIFPHRRNIIVSQQPKVVDRLIS